MILDTNAISAWADGQEEFLKILPGAHTLAFPVIGLGEYLWGLRRSRRRADLEEWLLKTLPLGLTLSITLSTVHHYATIRESLHAKGRPIPQNDQWIAALALEHQMPILSRDSDFDHVDGIERIGW